MSTGAFTLGIHRSLRSDHWTREGCTGHSSGMPIDKRTSSCSDLLSCCGLLLHVLGFTLLLLQPARAQDDFGTTNVEELAALYEVLNGIDGDTNWTAELPDPCNNWQTGIYCLPDDEGELHVTNLEFGIMSESIPVIPCSRRATLHPSVAKFPYLQTLQVFSCFTDQAAYIPKEIGTLGELQILTFQDNPALIGTLPIELGNVTSLQRFCVTGNGIDGVIPTEFGNLVNLIQLDLSRNQLAGPVPASINSLMNLRILNLGRNMLSGPLPPLNRLNNLVKMVLRNNLLNESIPSDLGQLTSLRYLDLSHNNFTGGLPPSFANLINLEDLFVGDNPMGTSLPGFLGLMPALTRLTLERSKFMGSIPREFGNMTKLHVLDLEGNSLSGSIPPELGSLPQIHILDLSRNNLSGPVPFSPEFVEKMGINFNLLNNTGLCIPHSTTTTRMAVAGIGLTTCIMGDPAEPASPDSRAQFPSLQPDSPSPRRNIATSRWTFNPSFSVAAVGCVIVFSFAP